MSERVSIRNQDCLEAEYTSATVVYLFLTEYGILRVVPSLLQKLSTGCRIVACMSPIVGKIPTASNSAPAICYIIMYVLGWEPDAICEDDGLGQIGESD